MLVLLTLLAPVFCLDWSLLNPAITTDEFVTASFGQDTIVAYTKTRIFTAAGDSKVFNQVPYSLNGSGSALEWIDSCYYDNTSIWVAVGRYESTAGQETLIVTTSSDAKHWAVTAQFTLQWLYPSVACGKNEIYLSTGVSVFQSIDGKKFTTKTPLASFDRMNYVPAYNYYVGWTHSLQSVFISSAVREVWDIHVGPPRYPFSNIVYGKNTWVIAGAGVVYWSTNLAGWTVSNIPLQSGFIFSGLSWIPNLNAFVITAHNSTGLYVFQSSDGNIWFSRREFETTRQIRTVVASSTYTYALGQTGLVLCSKDAVNWDLLSGDFWTTVSWMIQASSGVWYAPGLERWEDTVPLYSTYDGVKWVREPNNASATILSFPGPPSRSATNHWLSFDGEDVYSSNDASTWTPVFNAAYQNLQRLYSLYLDPTGTTWVLTATGYRTDELWTSNTDGQTWERVAPSLSKLHRVYPVGAKTFLTIQTDFRGDWVFVSRDGGVSWTNTSYDIKSPENTWLSNSRVVVFINNYNVTTTEIDGQFDSWTTQELKVPANSRWVVFKDSFVALYNNETWSSTDGLTWTFAKVPYFVETISMIGQSDEALMCVGSDGIAISAK